MGDIYGCGTRIPGYLAPLEAPPLRLPLEAPLRLPLRLLGPPAEQQTSEAQNRMAPHAPVLAIEVITRFLPWSRVLLHERG